MKWTCKRTVLRISGSFLLLIIIITYSIFWSYYWSDWSPQVLVQYFVRLSQFHGRSGLADLIQPERTDLPRRLYVCSTYFNEIYVFAFKMIALSKWTHRFVISWTSTSHSSQLKGNNMTFGPFDDIAERLGERLFIYKATLYDRTQRSWRKEIEHRATLDHALQAVDDKPRDDDLILLSDFDEMALDETIEHFLRAPPTSFSKVAMDTYYYSLRYRCDDRLKWVHPVFSLYGYFKRKGGASLWAKHVEPLQGVRGLHMSYCLGTVEAVSRKLKGFAHTEFGGYPYSDINYIYSRMACGMDLFTNTPTISEKRPIHLTPPLNISKYPWLEHPLLSWLTQRIPFIERSPSLDPDRVKAFGACDFALSALSDDALFHQK